jgi:hypothetical protein
MTVQEFVNIDINLQTVQDISDVNIIILIYLFIKDVLFILMFTDYFKFSFFPCTVVLWNALPPNIVFASSLDQFKSQI